MCVLTGRAHVAPIKHPVKHPTRTTQTHLLQLKLSPPAGIGISVERRSDAVSNGGGIHGGQAVGPTIASNALRGTSDFGWKRWPEAKRVGGWLSRGPGPEKIWAKIWLQAGRQGPRNGGADVLVWVRAGSRCVAPGAVSAASRRPACSDRGPRLAAQAWKALNLNTPDLRYATRRVPSVPVPAQFRFGKLLERLAN
jgi:hypothetical protein